MSASAVCGGHRALRRCSAWLAELRRIRRVLHSCGACAISVRRGISAARDELALARSAAAPGRAQTACGPVPVPIRAAAQQPKQRLYSDNGCRAASFRRAFAAEPVRQHSAAHGACDRLHLARCTPRSRRVRRRRIDRDRLKSAPRVDYRRAAAAGSAQRRRLWWHGTNGTQCTVSRTSGHKLASPHRSIHDSVIPLAHPPTPLRGVPGGRCTCSSTSSERRPVLRSASLSLRGRCSPLRLPKVAHASAKHTYSGRNTSRTDHRFWRTVNGWSSRRRVGAAGGRSHEGAAQQRARAAGSDVAPRCCACRGRDGRAETDRSAAQHELRPTLRRRWPTRSWR